MGAGAYMYLYYKFTDEPKALNTKGLGSQIITKTRLFKYIENFTSKNWKFTDKNLSYFSYFLLKTWIVGTH